MSPRERIPDTTRHLMLFVATLTWLISLIPFVDWVMDPLEWAIFWLWFRFRGASISKNWKGNLFSGVVSMVPTIGAVLGAFPVVIYRNVIRVQNEDMEYNQANSRASGI